MITISSLTTRNLTIRNEAYLNGKHSSLDKDNKRLAEKVYNIESNHKSVEVSNRGGYQSPIELEDEELIQEIKANTPTRKDKPLGVDDIGVYNWININNLNINCYTRRFKKN